MFRFRVRAANRFCLDGGLGLCRDDPCRQKNVSTEIAGEVGKPGPVSGAGDADGAHEKRHAVLLIGEDVLDTGAFPGPCGVGSGSWLGHGLAAWLSEVNLPSEPGLGDPSLVLR